MLFANRIRPNPWHILWKFATGHLPDFLNKHDGPVGWVRWSHRGVMRLDNIQFPKKQKRYIFDEKVQVRFDTAFEEVVRGCGDVSRFGKTWLTEDLIQGLLQLHRMGYAHSYEAWVGDQLGAGIFGIHLGGLVTLNSQFHRMSHVTKAVYGQTLIHLRERGFQFVDEGMVPDHAINYGVEWWPRWKFEAMLPRLLSQQIQLLPEKPSPPVPSWMRLGAKAVKLTRSAQLRLENLANIPNTHEVNCILTRSSANPPPLNTPDGIELRWAVAPGDTLLPLLDAFYESQDFGKKWATQMIEDGAEVVAALLPNPKQPNSPTIAAAALFTRRDFFVSEIPMTFRSAHGGCYLFGDHVHPEHRGRRLQRLLILARLHRAHNLGLPWLYTLVEPSNIPSLRNYEALGFATSARIDALSLGRLHLNHLRPLHPTLPWGALTNTPRLTSHHAWLTRR